MDEQSEASVSQLNKSALWINRRIKVHQAHPASSSTAAVLLSCLSFRCIWLPPEVPPLCSISLPWPVEPQCCHFSPRLPVGGRDVLDFRTGRCFGGGVANMGPMGTGELPHVPHKLPPAGLFYVHNWLSVAHLLFVCKLTRMFLVITVITSISMIIVTGQFISCLFFIPLVV